MQYTPTEIPLSNEKESTNNMQQHEGISVVLSERTRALPPGENECILCDSPLFMHTDL